MILFYGMDQTLLCFQNQSYSINYYYVSPLVKHSFISDFSLWSGMEYLLNSIDKSCQDFCVAHLLFALSLACVALISLWVPTKKTVMFDIYQNSSKYR